MYLNSIAIENAGPIESLRIAINRRDQQSAPVPLVIVGENGSGKTMLLATIADALYEFAAKAFRDVLPPLGMGHSYFKVLGGTNQRAGANYAFSVLRFSSNETPLIYVEKSGTLTLEELRHKLGENLDAPQGEWDNNENLKQTTNNEALIEKDFLQGANCFFPANRFEPPHWINPPTAEEIAGFSFSTRFKGQLDKPIAVDTATKETYQWLLDLVLDRSVYRDRGLPHHNLWESTNEIVRAVMAVPNARLGVGMRSSSGRIAIGVEENGRWVKTLAPTLRHLSAGQGVLLNLFATILRYADKGGTQDLTQITGIVVADEIDLHLHSQHQLEVLPRLISLFPKVQFVLSTHAPLVLLGLARILGKDGIQIVSLPTGQTIPPEAFSEFQVAFDAFRKTRTFEAEVALSAKAALRPQVLVEGEFDERYLKKALAIFGRQDLLERFDIKWVGRMDVQGPRFTGKDALNHAFEFLKGNPQFATAPVVFLYDWDANKPNENIGRLFVRSVPKNEANTKVQVGIENALTPNLFDERFYRVKEERSQLGEKKVNEVFDKKAFCDFLCDEREVAQEQAAEDFAGLRPVIAILEAIP